MLVIRLRRGGKKHQPHYRIVVQEQRSKLGGKYIESLGHYHPTTANKSITVDKERVLYWMKNGAKPSVTATNLFVKNDILPKEQKIAKVYGKKKKTKKESAETKAEKAKATPNESAQNEIKDEEKNEVKKPEPASEDKGASEEAAKEEISRTAKDEEVTDLKAEEIETDKAETK